MTLVGTLLLASFPLLITYYAKLYKELDIQQFPTHPTDFNLPVKDVFDFVIVGAGTAGSILANRLSKDYSVLVLEAGGDVPEIMDVPQLAASSWGLPEINFAYKTVPQKDLFLIQNGVELKVFEIICPSFLSVSTGKTLGGSNSHNGYVYQRGHPGCYDNWAKISRDSSWKYKNIKKYFKKIERYYTVKKEKNDERGFNGKLHIDQNTFHPGQDIFLKAAKYVNMSVVSTSKSQRAGFKIADATSKFGVRDTTYLAYLKPVESRKTLKIYKYSVVSKVITKNKRAVGVLYERHGIPRVAYASKEVILSAGAFLSPIILFKSGIGPAEEIAKAKAKPISILPVGRNLKTHFFYPLPAHRLDPQYTWSFDVLTQNDVDVYAQNQSGPLGSFLYANAEAYTASSFVKSSQPLDLHYAYLYTSSLKGAATIGVGLMESKSVGTLTLNASAVSVEDPFLPLIDPQSMSVEQDMDAMIEGIEFALKTFQTPPFIDAGAELIPDNVPQCNAFEFGTKDYWKCQVRYLGGIFDHVHSTVRMGYGKEDKNACVDSKLRVIGIEGLRVIDLSVVPDINANTMATVMVLAEKAVNDILREYAGKRKC